MTRDQVLADVRRAVESAFPDRDGEIMATVESWSRSVGQYHSAGGVVGVFRSDLGYTLHEVDLMMVELARSRIGIPYRGTPLFPILAREWDMLKKTIFWNSGVP